MISGKLAHYIREAEAVIRQIERKHYDEAIASCNALRGEMQKDSDTFQREQDSLEGVEGLYYASVYNALATINSVVISGNNLSPLLMALKEAKGEMEAIADMIATYEE